MSRPVLVVVGAGPGVSGSVARLFAGEGYDLGLVGVDEAVLAELRATIAEADVQTAVADITDTEAATLAMRTLGDHFGRIDVLHFNPSAFREKDPLELTVPELRQRRLVEPDQAEVVALPRESPGDRAAHPGTGTDHHDHRDHHWLVHGADPSRPRRS